MEGVVEPSRALRVLILTWRDGDHPEAGGAEVYVERTAQELTARGHAVAVFSAAFPGAPAMTRRGPVTITRRGGRFLCYPRGLQYLRSHADDFDVVVDVQNGIPFWSPVVSPVPVVNLVHHVHRDQWPIVFGPAMGRLGWFVESRAAPFVYRNCRYVTVSQATRAELAALGVDPERVAVTYSGNDQPFDLEEYDSIVRSPTPRVIVLGRLVPHKHVETAIDIVAELAPRHPDLALDIVGTGYWEDTLRAHAADRGVSDRVHFHGYVDEHTKRVLLARAWLHIMPSHKEGWGLTIVEAGLHGAPSVGFSFAGGVTESIVHDETGLLADDVAEMTAHADALLSDPALREKYADNGRRHARSFSWDKTARDLEKVLLEVTSPP